MSWIVTSHDLERALNKAPNYWFVCLQCPYPEPLQKNQLKAQFPGCCGSRPTQERSDPQRHCFCGLDDCTGYPATPLRAIAADRKDQEDAEPDDEPLGVVSEEPNEGDFNGPPDPCMSPSNVNAGPPASTTSEDRIAQQRRPPSLLRPSRSEAITVPNFDSSKLPTTHGAYGGKTEQRHEIYGKKKQRSMAELIGLGFQLISWDGRTPHPLVDAAGRIFAVLAGQPTDPSYPDAVRSAYAFAKAQVAFALWAPWLYGLYVENNRSCIAAFPTSKAIQQSVFACAAFNFGNVCTYRHRDVCNLPFGWWAIQSLGNFDAKKGGHLILWDVKAVVEFPAGASFSFPPPRSPLKCASCARGGTFRTQTQLATEDPVEHDRLMNAKESRWEKGLKLFSTIDELIKRAEIENDLCLKSAGRHKAALASARYRHKKQQKEWAEHNATHAEKYRARKDEADGLRRKHLAMTSQAEEAGHATPAPVKKKLQIFYASPRRVARPGPAHDDESSSDGSEHLSRPTPRTHRKLAQEDYNASKKGRKGRQVAPPIFEHRVAHDACRCQYCFQEGCPGCACMCEESTVWMQHEGGHFFPTCKKCGEEDCPGCAYNFLWTSAFTMAKVFFCLPLYKPEPGHENKEVHDASPRAHYYAIVSGKEGIVVTTEDAMAREMKPDPNARNFSASTWKEIMDLWIKDCELNHEHIPVHDLVTPDSTPTRVPPKSVTRGHPTHSPSKAAAKPLTTEEVAAKFENIFTASPTKTKSHRSDRAKGATKPRLNSSAVDDAAHEVGSEPLLLYGVTGHNRLFRSKERAMAVLKATPGADLVFAHDEAGVEDFIRTEGARVMKSST
ncbi:hypothetical protein K438DRAFT_2002606 [Mycena galopus ATCC 62051]|nr:hypothetical protein K438DRAFT_2002606 [Mycena galopus ATCC 62051]